MTGFVMDEKRYIEIEFNGAQLLPEEYRQGFHYCENWNDMLVGPDMPEWDCCNCDISYKRRNVGVEC